MRENVDKPGLSLSVLGIENHVKGRACFRSMMHKCNAVFNGKNDILDHLRRTKLALDEFKIAVWPYKGAIALRVQFGRLKQCHFLDIWRYYGSYKSEISLKKYILRMNTLFDSDMYKKLMRPILTDRAHIITLE